MLSAGPREQTGHLQRNWGDCLHNILCPRRLFQICPQVKNRKGLEKRSYKAKDQHLPGVWCPAPPPPPRECLRMRVLTHAAAPREVAESPSAGRGPGGGGCLGKGGGRCRKGRPRCLLLPARPASCGGGVCTEHAWEGEALPQAAPGQENSPARQGIARLHSSCVC